jgi:predicted Zn finger-like uncharacterized protein
MILTCPSCGTQYVVKDGAIPPQGRQVRCASCKHSWHQDPEHADAADEPAQAAVAADYQERVEDQAEAEDADETLAEVTLIGPSNGPEAEERAYEEALVEDADEGSAEPVQSAELPVSDEAPAVADANWDAPPQLEPQDDEFSPFAAPDEVEPHRRSSLVTMLVVVLVVAALAAAFWFLAPDPWKARVGLGDSGTSPLALVTTHMDRQRLESGNELLTETGRVINPTASDQSVPPLQAQLRTSAGQVVYSWTIAPPARSLPPGASARFNSTEVDVPPGGDELTITIGSPKA